MNSRKAYLIVSWLTIQVLLVVSCETEHQPIHSNAQPTNKTLRLNFQENILEVNPLKTNNRAEQFVIDLTFDKFFNSDGTSSVFKGYRYDSLEKTYFFELHPNNTFHDGTLVDSESIRLLFKHLLQFHFQSEAVKELFSSMDGFGLINWYRENLNIYDSIPSGFRIINDNSFTIQMSKNEDQLPKWFQDEMYVLFKFKNNSYVGSGLYELIELNEDISAKLSRRKKDGPKIETIHISFTKNVDLVYSEFFRGSLDLAFYNPHIQLNTKHKQDLDKVIRNKYAQYQTSTTNQTIITYMEIHAQDTILQKRILGAIPDINNKLVYSSYSNDLDNLTYNALDSPNYEVKLYSQVSEDETIYFKNSPSLALIKSNMKNLNPTEPHIVIRKESSEFVSSLDLQSIEILMEKKLEKSHYTTFVVLGVFHEYVIFSNRLKGIETGHGLSELVKQAYFENAKSY
ncbi:hypothetical protein SAMN04488029_2191 [Reichenbachiella faecimaris]|uniref:Extracellular solute-binding protein, family 5 Middle n=1 Tax=Reichenbachiella faecimaris TaxID=692418 RepID=A0A1W2GDZ1_REIFA|nr:hypothetical protein [Reichenbachiella faecimaris]SMD34811.1 hypothetical protein SAMN04488029_2191 [Reichenbachiella faecimaris]